MIETQTFTGPGIVPYVDAVAELRIAVFRDWPYLYAGDRAYERDYLATYSGSTESLFVLAFDGDRVVGASTGIPLDQESAAHMRPFHERDIAVDEVFYFGESVLLDEYRGRGIGHRFFDEREACARRLGRFGMTAFCSVERDEDDPRRPPNPRSNDLFWTKRGYRRQSDMVCELAWPEIGQVLPTRQRMCFWLRTLERT